MRTWDVHLNVLVCFHAITVSLIIEIQFSSLQYYRVLISRGKNIQIEIESGKGKKKRENFHADLISKLMIPYNLRCFYFLF